MHFYFLFFFNLLKFFFNYLIYFEEKYFKSFDLFIINNLHICIVTGIKKI